MILCIVLSSCNATKFVPEGKYLLNKAQVKCVDDKTVPTSTLRNYLRQRQNTEILGFWKLQLDIYNTAPLDTTTQSNQRLARNAKKMGEAPVVYDPELTEISMQQLRQQMNNMGYFHAEVDTSVTIKKRKLNLTYLVTAHQPYTIRRYEVDIPNEAVRAIATNERCLIKEGAQFSTATMDEERARIATALRNRGYFYFEKSMLEFTADSSLNSHQVDLRIHLAPFVEHLDSATLAQLRKRYYIREVSYKMDKPFLRKSALRRACRIKEGERYAEWRVERTYARMNALAPVKYVDIAFTPVGDTLLDCSITVSRGRLNSVAAEVEGTYSAGDWGIAAGVNYSNKNIFKGAEVLSLGARASYEWRANGGRAIEAKAEAGLLFPSNVKVNIAYNYQQRPDEYTRTIANAGLSYIIPRQPGSRWTHQFNLIDINYIYLPWVSEQFKQEFMDRSSVLKASYENHFILDWSYTGTFTTYNARNPNRSYLQLSLYAETAGNALYGLSAAAGFQKNDDGSYILWRIPFAQYAKVDFDYVRNFRIDYNNTLVFHLGFGLAYPYGNSNILPFEKRYFSGGANSVRGWSVRNLGPGKFRGKDGNIDFINQTGDMKLDVNLEYRAHLFWKIDGALFIDAGNVWTLRNYEDQPGGQFAYDTFLEQIAVGYGMGFRFNFDYFILRFDMGMKGIDPAYERASEHYPFTHPRLSRDFTFHFAVGLPF